MHVSKSPNTMAHTRGLPKVGLILLLVGLVGFYLRKTESQKNTVTLREQMKLTSDVTSAEVRIQEPNYETALSKISGCGTSSFSVGPISPAAAPPKPSEMWVPSAVSGCVKLKDRVMLWNSQTGAFEFNRVASIGTPTNGRVLVAFIQTLKHPQTEGSPYNFLVRPIYSRGNIVLPRTPESSSFQGKAWDGSSGGVIVLWSDGDILIERDMSVSQLGYRGGSVSPLVGPEGPKGRETILGGGGGGGSPGHGCGRVPGWFTNDIGRGIDGGGNPIRIDGVGGTGGSGSPGGGGGGGAGYGWHAGAGGRATSPGGNGGSKVNNAGQNGANAVGPRGGGGGGGGDRDNGGGGGGGSPVSSLGNAATTTSLFLGGGAASGAGGGGGAAQGDYQCAQGGTGGSKLGLGGPAGRDACTRPKLQSPTAGGNGRGGGSGGGLIVLIGYKIVIKSGVTVSANGGAGGTGGAGGRGTHGACYTHPYGGSGGGGGGADGAAGGTVAYAGILQNSGKIEANGGNGGSGGQGGTNGRGKGGNGGEGNAGASGKILQISNPPPLPGCSTNSDCNSGSCCGVFQWKYCTNTQPNSLRVGSPCHCSQECQQSSQNLTCDEGTCRFVPNTQSPTTSPTKRPTNLPTKSPTPQPCTTHSDCLNNGTCCFGKCTNHGPGTIANLYPGPPNGPKLLPCTCNFECHRPCQRITGGCSNGGECHIDTGGNSADIHSNGAVCREGDTNCVCVSVCLAAESIVHIRRDDKEMSVKLNETRRGDSVLVADDRTGRLFYDEIVLFHHFGRDKARKTMAFVNVIEYEVIQDNGKIQTENVKITDGHLMYSSRDGKRIVTDAKRIKKGDKIWVRNDDGLYEVEVTDVRREYVDVVNVVTRTGNYLANDVLVSSHMGRIEMDHRLKTVVFGVYFEWLPRILFWKDDVDLYDYEFIRVFIRSLLVPLARMKPIALAFGVSD